jgi:ABC-type nickel/cobalt efflux system permease component RcnA
LFLADINIPGGFPVWATLALGFVLGLRHALDPDHVAAVSTFVTEERNLLRSSLVGIYWGMGHTAALAIFGAGIVAFRWVVNPRLSQFFEFAVGCMLIILGLRVLFQIRKRQAIHAHTHTHGGTTHSHLHFHLAEGGHEHEHHTLRFRKKPFVVGVVHGMAGTAAVLLVVVGAIPSLLLAFGTILIFGVGTIGGMMAMSVLMSVPIALAAGRWLAVERGIRLLAGFFSLGFGIFWAWQVGFLQAYFH